MNPLLNVLNTEIKRSMMVYWYGGKVNTAIVEYQLKK